MAKSVDDILKIATREWGHWGSSVWNLINGKKKIGHTDDEKAFAEYVIKYYNSAGGGAPTADEISNDQYFWSAVGISFVFKEAGFKKAEFPFAEAHSVWIRRFVKARKDKDQTALYHGYRLNEADATPEVGDIVGYTYAKKVNFEKAQAYFDKTGSYQSHTDIVIAKRPGEIDVIGFNVLDSVTKKTVPLAANGLIADRTHKWFVVLRKRKLA
jgi:hypothetical protein